MTTNEHDQLIDGAPRSPSWLFDHIGRLVGLGAGFVVFILLIYLAAIGFVPALGIIVFVVSGVLLIIGGGKIHRA